MLTNLLVLSSLDETRNDPHQKRQEPTAAEQISPAEVRPVASNLRVILPIDNDELVSVSTPVIQNQNSVDLPPSYHECCCPTTSPTSTLDKGDVELEEEDPPTYVEFLKEIINQRRNENERILIIT